MSHARGFRDSSTILALFLSGGLGLIPGFADFDPFRVSRVRSSRSARLDSAHADIGQEAGEAVYCEQADNHSSLTLGAGSSKKSAAIAPLAAESVSVVSSAPEFIWTELVPDETPGLPRAGEHSFSARGPPSDSLL